jgi:hypothetical protein
VITRGLLDEAVALLDTCRAKDTRLATAESYKGPTTVRTAPVVWALALGRAAL